MDPQRLPELLAYRCPELERRLLRDRAVSSRAQARRLLDELKKYLWLTEVHADRALPMRSPRVDDVWHAFMGLTHAYAAFSQRFFGSFQHHFPDSAPDAGRPPRPVLDLEGFRAAYEALFGPLSPLWMDEAAVDVGTRLVRSPGPHALSVRARQGEGVELVYGDTSLLRVSRPGRPALEFIARHEHFYVRELPGTSPKQGAALCRPLVRWGLLQVLP